jgi:hypothetical protein
LWIGLLITRAGRHGRGQRPLGRAGGPQVSCRPRHPVSRRRPAGSRCTAIFTALVAYIGLYFLVQWRYPTFRTPLTALVPITGDGRSLTSHLGTNILTINQNAIYDASGHAVSQATVQSLCPSGPGPGSVNANSQCLAQHHLKTLLSYQPGTRIPDFHLILIGGYLSLGLIAAAVVWWLVRRTSISAG